MKTFILKISAFACVAFLLITALSVTSCKKDKTCHGKVTVVDTAGIVVAGASVVLSAPSVNGQVSSSNITDASGVALFEIKLPAIFDIVASKNDAFPNMTGKGILRVDEPGKTADVTVTLKP